LIEPDDEFESDVRDLVLRLLKLSEPLTSELARGSVPQWDSLKHMEIVFALEDRYAIQFDESEFDALDSPPAIARVLRMHLAP
jgi:acyl carrier protein